MKIISVFGSSATPPDSIDYAMSQEVGKLLAEAGFAVQTGGYDGVMGAASRGASEAGGHVIGITSEQIESFRKKPCNPWVKEEIKYVTLRERLLHLVEKCDGCVVMPGGIGTISELTLMWSFVQVGEVSPCPIVLVGELWQQTMTAFISADYVRPHHAELISLVETPAEAVATIQAALA